MDGFFLLTDPHFGLTYLKKKTKYFVFKRHWEKKTNKKREKKNYTKHNHSRNSKISQEEEEEEKTKEEGKRAKNDIKRLFLKSGSLCY